MERDALSVIHLYLYSYYSPLHLKISKVRDTLASMKIAFTNDCVVMLQWRHLHKNTHLLSELSKKLYCYRKMSYHLCTMSVNLD